MRLLLTTIATFILLAMVILTARFWGLSQWPATFDHPWFAFKTPWVVTTLNHIDNSRPNVILWINVLRSTDRKLFALRDRIDASQTKFTSDQLMAKGERLDAVLARYANRNLVLNILSNEEDIDVQVSELVGKTGEGRILLQSDFEVILRSVKKLQPLWLFGTSQADRVRFATFESLWLLPAIPFKGDVYIGPFQQKGIPIFNEEIAEELKRRGKKVILGPLESKEQYEQALRLGVDGVFIDQPELIGLTL